MKKLAVIFSFLIPFALVVSVNAGHDFMNEMRKASTLIKEESCSNGRTKIEHRRINTANIEVSMVLVILEPDAASKKSEFYRESNKDFYSLIFYKLFNDKAPGASYMIKRVQSGDLKEFNFPQWLQELEKADPNAAKNLTNQSSSNCSVTYQMPSR